MGEYEPTLREKRRAGKPERSSGSWLPILLFVVALVVVTAAVAAIIAAAL